MNTVINKKTAKNIIYIMLIYVFFSNFFITQFNLPSILNYFLDILNIALLVHIIQRDDNLNTINKVKIRPFFYILSLLFLVIIIGDVVNLVSPLLILWALRNSFRFIVFFFACISVLEKQDIENIFKLVVDLQILNVLLSLFQFFILGIKQDYLGGIFGIKQGCNTYSNVYFCSILTFTLSQFLSGKASIYKLVWILLSTLLLAALAELKIYFVEVILILGLSILFSKINLKNIIAFLSFIIFLLIGLRLFAFVFPGAYKMVVNIDELFEYGSATGGGYNISRFGAFSEINDLFFDNNTFKKLFGLGFGNCEYSSFSFLTSNFYNKYGEYNYRWFSHEMWFLETGYLGFCLFVLLFVFLFIWATKNKKYCSYYGHFLQIFSIITIVNLWYNSATRVECGYIVYFVLVACLIVYKSNITELKNKKTNLLD